MALGGMGRTIDAFAQSCKKFGRGCVRVAFYWAGVLKLLQCSFDLGNVVADGQLPEEIGEKVVVSGGAGCLSVCCNSLAFSKLLVGRA